MFSLKSPFTFRWQKDRETLLEFLCNRSFALRAQKDKSPIGGGGMLYLSYNNFGQI
jgi:hypothetical protein